MSVAVLIQGLLLVTILIVTGLVGSTRRLGFFLTLVASILLTPIGGFVLALLSGSRQRTARRRPLWERFAEDDDPPARGSDG